MLGISDFRWTLLLERTTRRFEVEALRRLDYRMVQCDRAVGGDVQHHVRARAACADDRDAGHGRDERRGLRSDEEPNPGGSRSALGVAGAAKLFSHSVARLRQSLRYCLGRFS